MLQFYAALADIGTPVIWTMVVYCICSCRLSNDYPQSKAMINHSKACCSENLFDNHHHPHNPVMMSSPQPRAAVTMFYTAVHAILSMPSLTGFPTIERDLSHLFPMLNGLTSFLLKLSIYRFCRRPAML